MRNQPVPRPPPTSYAIFSGKIFYLLNHLKISTITHLIGLFKSETLYCKISMLERLGNGMYLRNGNVPKQRK